MERREKQGLEGGWKRAGNWLAIWLGFAGGDCEEMTSPRKHHFIQQAHLALFAGNCGKLFVYAKNGESFRTKPRNIFAVRDLYSFSQSGKINATFEVELSKLESSTFPYIKEMAQGAEFTPERKESAIVYMACSILRNPACQRMAFDLLRANVEAVALSLDRSNKIPRFPSLGSKLDGKSISDLLRSGDLEIEINNSQYLRIFVDTFQTIISALRNFKLYILRSEVGSVAIGDHPFTYVHPGIDFGDYGPPIGGEKCEIAFPISKHVVLIGLWSEDLPLLHSEQAIAQLNARQVMFATSHLASAHHLPEAAGWLSRYRGLSFRSEINLTPNETGSFILGRRALLPAHILKKVLGDIVPLTSFILR